MTIQSSYKILPILFGFFIMGFCDVVGISTSYVKADYHLSETVANLLPTMVFLWFLLLSVPTAIVMNKIGRKNMVLVSMVVTMVGMLIPFIGYSFTTCLIAFALLGIGNTILQVSLNPLLTNVVKGDALTSSLTTGQVIKAVSSFCGPFIAIFAVSAFGKWQFLFPVFALITLISGIWLLFTPITEKPEEKASGIAQTFALLGDKTILLLFLGILFVVGTDVGMNTVTPKLLMERCSLSVADSGMGSSVYFALRTIGALIGAVLLANYSAVKYFRISILVAAFAMVILFFMTNLISVLVLVGVIGFACSSIFPIIYSMAIQARPEKANEISGLMITGVFGGAVIPPLMGIAADTIGNQNGSLLVILMSIGYLVFCSFGLTKKVAVI
jgi:MFS transporter, FHS family, L-fucose permease